MLALAREACADAIVRTQAMRATNIAEIFIEKQDVRIEMEIGLSELDAFSNLLPNALYERITGESAPLADRLEAFFGRDLAIMVDGEQVLQGQVVEIGPRERVRRDDVTGEPLIGEGGEPETVIFARLAYPIESLPQTVTIVNGRSAGIGFVAYHEGVAVNDFRYLSPAQTLVLDWKDPWYTAFEERSLRRTYFAPMSAFIYVEPYEVRKEIILRPRDLQHWVDLGLEGRHTIPVEMQPELKRRVAEFLKTRHVTTIDDQPVEGELTRINFLERTLKTSNVIDPPRELDLNVATLGVIFVYPTVEPLPQNVKVVWDMFNEKMPIVPAASVDQAGSLPIFLEPDYAVLEWQNFLRFPELPTLRFIEPPPARLMAILAQGRWVLIGMILLGLLWAGRLLLRGEVSRQRVAAAMIGGLLVGGGGIYLGERARVSDAETRLLVADLLHNVYRAFDFRAEGDIYDVLAQSVAGDLLTAVYLETRRGLVLENQGGARAKVKRIELRDLSARPSDDGGFIADVSWEVAGSVGHWGHLHERRNGYQAELDIRPVDGSWKLVGMDVLAEERL